VTTGAAAGTAGHGPGEVTFFSDPGMDLMAGVIFEVAAQLHEERAARLALQSALLSAGLLDGSAIAAAAVQPSTRAGSKAELDRSLASLLRVLVQRDDARAPLARAPLAGDPVLAPVSERRP